MRFFYYLSLRGKKQKQNKDDFPLSFTLLNAIMEFNTLLQITALEHLLIRNE
jgi:hypothetical protein